MKINKISDKIVFYSKNGVKNIIDLLKNKSKPYIKENPDLFVFFIIIYLKCMVYGSHISSNEFKYKPGFFPVVASIFIFISVPCLVKKFKRAIFLYILDFCITVFISADLMFYAKYKDVANLSSVGNLIKYGFNLDNVIRSKYIFIYYFIDLIILIPVIVKYSEINKRESSKKERVITFSVFIVLGTLINCICFKIFSYNNPNLIRTMSDKLYLCRKVGNLNFHMIDTYNYCINNKGILERVSPGRKKDINNLFKKNRENLGVQFKEEGDKKNLIVIQVEALQNFVINKEIEGRTITPNLNRWISKSLYFDNFFSQSEMGITSDAEFVINNSIYPNSKTPTYYAYCSNKFDSMPKRLWYKGYNTAAFSGEDHSFWNRAIMYRAQGFQKFYSKNAFNIKNDFSGKEIIGQAISDKYFFNENIKKIKSLKEPYYAFMVTSSSRYPFKNYNGQYGEFYVGKYENTFIGDYIKAMHYVDLEIGMFLDEMDKEGVLEDSIVLICGSYPGVDYTHINELYDFSNVSHKTQLNNFLYNRVPMFIHFPKDKYKGVDHRYSGQADIYPTLSNIFDLGANYVYGQDLLNEDLEKKYVLFEDGSFIDGDNIYISSNNSYYNLKSGEKINESVNLKNKKEDFKKVLKFSHDTLKYDLIDTLEHE